MKYLFYLLMFPFLFIAKLHAVGEDEFNLMVLDTLENFTAFDNIQVLDMRVHKEDAGYLRLGPFNKKTRLVCKNGFDQMLQNYVKQVTKQPAMPGTKTLLLVVRDFSLADRPVASEMGTFYARIDFYAGVQDHFEPIIKVDSFFETSNGWDVTQSVRKMAANKILDWLRQVSHYQAGTGNKERITLTEIKLKIEKEKDLFPVYKQEHRVGIYYTLEQFLNNTPEDTTFIQKNYSSSGTNIVYFYKKQEGKKRGDNLDKIPCYALFNGKKWYKKTTLGMMEMKFINNDFYFPEMAVGIKSASDNVAIMFGLVGALIANGANGEGNAVYRMRLDPATRTPVCTERL